MEDAKRVGCAVGEIAGKELIETAGERDSVRLGIGGSEAATPIPRAGDGSGKDGASGELEASIEQSLLRERQRARGDIGDEQVLPYGEADLS